jgi:hypothetical protein
MATGLDVIKRAMRIAGVIGQNETPSSSEAADGLVALNDMLALWAIDRTYAYTIDQSNFPLVSGTASYTIGTGGTFNTTRPVKIDGAFVRINSVDYPLQEINSNDYDSIAYKTNSNIPEFFYYDNAFPLGTITLYGVPTTGTIYIEQWHQLTQFTNLATDLTFPPGYSTAIAYNLAEFICPEYGVSLTPEAADIAKSSAALVRNHNLPAPVMKTEVGCLVGSGGYNYQRGY